MRNIPDTGARVCLLNLVRSHTLTPARTASSPPSPTRGRREKRERDYTFRSVSNSKDRHCEPTGRANTRPMTASLLFLAPPSPAKRRGRDSEARPWVGAKCRGGGGARQRADNHCATQTPTRHVVRCAHNGHPPHRGGGIGKPHGNDGFVTGCRGRITDQIAARPGEGKPGRAINPAADHRHAGAAEAKKTERRRGVGYASGTNEADERGSGARSSPPAARQTPPPRQSKTRLCWSRAPSAASPPPPASSATTR